MPIIQVTSQGIQSTNRDNILQYLITAFKSVYGDNVYITEGTEDYNMLSTLADLFNDMGVVAVSVGNGFNLQNATGYQLDNIATIFYNTVNRKPATYSTVEVTISGTPNTNISFGIVRDDTGGLWNLPDNVTIPAGGSINVTATHNEAGPYLIDANQISGYSSIVTPVAGWTNVVNSNASTVGQDVESDAKFRYRLAVKAQGLSKSVLETLQTNILADEQISNVMIWENDTSGTLSYSNVGLNDIPSHSIVVSVYGTIDNQSLGETIYNYKGTGVGTFAPASGTGSTSVTITNAFGTPQTINFVNAVTQEIEVTVTLQKLTTLVPDPSTELQTAIADAIVSQINDLNIGSVVYANTLYVTVATAITNTVGPNVYNITSITLGSSASSQQMLYYQKPFAQNSGITINAN